MLMSDMTYLEMLCMSILMLGWLMVLLLFSDSEFPVRVMMITVG